MKWFKENPFLAGLTVVTLICAGALGYLISQAVLAYSASSESYTSAITKLHGLQNKAPFPSSENLKKIQGGIEDYSSRIRALQSLLSKMEVPLDESVSPQQFQDGLRTAVNEIKEKAEARKVKLPENFYFGFDQYQAQVPTAAAAPALFRQFKVIQSLVSRLVDFKVTSLDAVVRPPLPEEAAPSQKKADSPDPVFKKFPFDISFTAEQGQFRTFFNSLLGSEPFLIIRSVGIQNTSTQAPAKASSAEAAAKPANPFASIVGEKGESKKSLQVILGRELMKATLRLEMLDFAEPAETKK